MINNLITENVPIDIFAHVLAPQFYQRMLTIDHTIPDQAAYINNQALLDLKYRQAKQIVATRQVISMVNLNPEDYVDSEQALALCWAANEELAAMAAQNPNQFIGAVAMVPMNNLAGALKIMTEQVMGNPKLLGIQLFTRALGKSIATIDYEPLFAMASTLALPIWLHPIFDTRKPDNNIVFSWEYELTQAMQQLVLKGVFQRYPQLKVIVHHAGGMVPFFAGRINAILTPQQARDFHKFFVDTAILGNPLALDLTVAFFGADHVLFGTDAPFGSLPVGASAMILKAITRMHISDQEKQQIEFTNALRLLNQ